MSRLYGITTATGPGSPAAATRNACRTACGICRTSATGYTAFVTGLSSATVSSEWTWNGRALSPPATSPTSATTGTESSSASPNPVSALVTPGPGTTHTTPGLPDTRAAPSAMHAAANSWAASRYGTPRALNSSHSSFSCAPGMPNTHPTASALSASATACAPVSLPTTHPAGGGRSRSSGPPAAVPADASTAPPAAADTSSRVRRVNGRSMACVRQTGGNRPTRQDRIGRPAGRA